MKPSDNKNSEILGFFKESNISAVRVGEGLIKINRDDCHNSPIFLDLHEFDIIDKIQLLVSAIAGDEYYTCGSGKTDDDWFWQIYKRPEQTLSQMQKF